MRVQHLEGDPKTLSRDTKPSYLRKVTEMRLQEVTPEVAQYVRAKKLAVRLRTYATRSEAGHAT